jgi:hypothetical protein
MNKELSEKDWNEFRNEVFELVMIYHQVKEYSNFDPDKIKNIKSFFFLSKRNAITAFFIKVGFILSNGITTLKDFIDDEKFKHVSMIYRAKLQLIRNKIYAHNAKSDKRLTEFSLSNEDVDLLFNQIITLSKEVDKEFQVEFNYDFVIGAEGIKSLENIIESSNDLIILKKKLMTLGYQAKVKLDISTGKLNVIN